MKNVKTKEKFEEDARKIHGTRYLCKDTIYIKDSQKLEVTCRIHGNFWVGARDHLNGKNCKERSKLPQKVDRNYWDQWLLKKYHEYL